jgi:hypothetical protein
MDPFTGSCRLEVTHRFGADDWTRKAGPDFELDKVGSNIFITGTATVGKKALLGAAWLSGVISCLSGPFGNSASQRSGLCYMGNG